MDAHAALFVAGVLAPRLQDLIDELCDAEHILVRLRGQAEHEVELHIVPAALKGNGAGIEDLLLRDILIDGVAQALRTGLRRERQAALAHLLQPQHEIAGKIVRAQRRQREIDLARRAVIEHGICQLWQAAVVGS